LGLLSHDEPTLPLRLALTAAVFSLASPALAQVAAPADSAVNIGEIVTASTRQQSVAQSETLRKASKGLVRIHILVSDLSAI